MLEKLYDMLMNENEITWQTIIYDLVKSEQMDPWDIDVSLLAKRYNDTVKKMHEMNFFISGKVLLAAAVLLRIKSNKLIDEDIANFNDMLYPPNVEDIDLTEPEWHRQNPDIPDLAIKTPQPRKRKVVLADLLHALQKALEVNHRKVMRRLNSLNFRPPEIPQKKVDISALIKDVYNKVLAFFKKQDSLTFTQLVNNSSSKEDKILAFIPLLHLDTMEKIDLRQKEHFGEIEIHPK